MYQTQIDPESVGVYQTITDSGYKWRPSGPQSLMGTNESQEKKGK